jgi:hypothetical protein
MGEITSQLALTNPSLSQKLLKRHFCTQAGGCRYFIKSVAGEVGIYTLPPGFQPASNIADEPLSAVIQA